MNATTLIQLSPEDLSEIVTKAVSKALEAQSAPAGFLRVPEAAAFLGMTEQGLRQAIKRSQIPSHRLGERVLLDPTELREHILSGRAAL